MNPRPDPRAQQECGIPGLISVPAALLALSEAQCGVVTREQLYAVGFSKEHVRAAVAAHRWQAIGRRVVVMHNSALSVPQRRWAAVLLPGKPAALAGLTAAAVAGLTGFDGAQIHGAHIHGAQIHGAQIHGTQIHGTQIHGAQIHIVVADDSNAQYPPWVAVHNSRRFAQADLAPGHGVPRTRPARSIIDAAAWQPYPRRAVALLCAAVQQRVTSAWALDRELAAAGSVRHASVMREVLGDIDGGAHTLDELDLAPLAALAGLAPPRRQAVRHEPDGRERYVDAEFDLPDGQLLVVEVDGAVHLSPQTWWDDMARQNELVIGGSPVLRFSSTDIRLEPGRVVDQLSRVRRAHPK